MVLTSYIEINFFDFCSQEDLLYRQWMDQFNTSWNTDPLAIHALGLYTLKRSGIINVRNRRAISLHSLPGSWGNAR